MLFSGIVSSLSHDWVQRGYSTLVALGNPTLDPDFYTAACDAAALPGQIWENVLEAVLNEQT